MNDRKPAEPSLDGADTDAANADRGASEPAEPAAEKLSDGNYVGKNNIRDGMVGGVIGGPHQQGGEGQGG